MLRVFISSTYVDLIAYREVVYVALRQMGQAPYDLTAADERPVELCLQRVDECDLFVGIYANRLGWVPANDNPRGDSITMMEFYRARERNKPMLLFAASGEVGASAPEEPPALRDKQRDFVANVVKPHRATGKPFTTPESLGAEFAVAFRNWERRPDFSDYVASLKAELEEAGASPLEEVKLPLSETIPAMVKVEREKGLGEVLSSEDEAEASRSKSLDEVLLQHDRILLLGDGGTGKTIALRQLCYRTACRWKSESATEGAPVLPILINLQGFQSDLMGSALQALVQYGLPSDRSLFVEWMKRTRVLFLLDTFDEADFPKGLAKEMQEISRWAPLAKVVVTSREVASLSSLGAIKRGLLVPLEIGEALKLLSFLIGPKDSGSVFQKLRGLRFEELLRRPLLLFLIAMAWREVIEAESGAFSLTALYRSAIEDRWLARWEARHGNPDRVEDKIALLAAIGWQLIRSRRSQITWVEVVECCQTSRATRGRFLDAEYVRRALTELAEAGVLVHAGEGFAFWHKSFTDYFCALYLSRHCPEWRFPIYGWMPVYHNAMLFLVGLVTEQVAERFLLSLLVGVRYCSLFLQDLAGSRVLLFVRCAALGGKDLRHVVRKLFGVLPPTIYLPDEVSRGAEGWELPYTELCTLLISLGMEEAEEYLKTAEFPRKSVLSAFFSTDRPDIHDELIRLLKGCPTRLRKAEGGSDERGAVWALAWNFLSSPIEEHHRRLCEAMETATEPELAYLVHNLEMGLASNRSEIDEDLRSAWINTGCSLFLKAETRRVCEELLNFIRQLSGGGLASGEVRFFAKTAVMGEFFHQRIVAVNALAYANEDSKMVEAVARCIACFDNSHALVFEALWIFKLRFPRVFPITMIRVLRRLVRGGRIVPTTSYRQAPREGQSRCRRVEGLLTAGCVDAEEPIERAYSIRAAVAVMGERICQVLKDRWGKEGEEFVKNEILCGLAKILGTHVEPYLVEALKDGTSVLKGRACVLLDRMGFSREVKHRCAPLLYQMISVVRTDWDNDGNCFHAAKVLRSIGYLPENYVYGLTPISEYSGPTVSDALT